MGSVDGNRIWGKELKGTPLTNVEWSPDGQILLFSLRSGEVHVYDSQGAFMMKLGIQSPSSVGANAIIGLQWYNGKYGHVQPGCPVLAICFATGQLFLLRDENDEGIVVDTGMANSCCQWNHNGSILAVAGNVPPNKEEDTASNALQLFTPFGEHLRTLKVPGKYVSSCVWEGGSLRLALGVDSYIYFANLRPDYKWGYCANTVVYSYVKPDRPEACVVFWDTKNNECYTKYISRLLGIAAAGEHCVLATRTDASDGGRYGLILCNAIGTPVDTKYIDVEPVWITMNSTHVIAASKEYFFVWHFRTPKSRSTLEIAGSRRERKEKVYHIDDSPSGAADIMKDRDKGIREVMSTLDPICCVAASEKLLLICRESGVLQRYSLPQIALTNRISLACRPYKLAVNCDSTRAAVIDVTGVLTLIELEPSSVEGASELIRNFERRDTWDVKWASDNAELFAIMEKTRMYVFRNLDPEEPILSSGYICCFQDLELKAVLLDEVMQCADPLGPQHLLQLEVKSLRDTRELLAKVGLAEASAFIEENPHPRLWRLLAEAAVEQLNLPVAETAFVRCKDYPGIQLVKRLHSMNNDTLKRAEVAAYFKNFDQAEKLYLDVDRRDLAIALRERLGDWFRVVQLIKMGPGGSDTQLEQAWNCIGDFLADRHNWEAAKEYYEKGGNQEKLVQCYYNLEEYEALETMVQELPESHPLLPVIADRLASVGLCEQAVTAYIKCGQVRVAVETCVALQQWSQAVRLAEQHRLEDIAALLAQYAEHLTSKGELGQAVELYRKAGRMLDAANIMFKLAEAAAARRSPPLHIKKLYLLGALLVTERGATSMHDPLLAVDNAWRGVEAFHFLMLAERQLYQGYLDAAMKTALRLQEYESLLDAEAVFSLIALTSGCSRAFATCSKAFIKLEALQQIPESRQKKYEQLAVELFTKFPVRDTRVATSSSSVECSTCETLVPGSSTCCPSCDAYFPACVASGSPLSDLRSAWTCSVCKHSAHASEMASRVSCPLCHTAVRR
ncbi:hypothetical protein B566_EDAN014960 [Ephemera danica]|nr:hypothetical protein B566_EDAN014960 [Ephemera danica]